MVLLKIRNELMLTKNIQQVNENCAKTPKKIIFQKKKFIFFSSLYLFLDKYS